MVFPGARAVVLRHRGSAAAGRAARRRSSARSPRSSRPRTTLFPVLIVGAPLRVAGRLYNTAVVIHRGAILGVVPKTYLPNYREFYEKRHFVSGANVHRAARSRSPARTVPFGTDLLFRSTGIGRRSPSMSRSARTSGCRCRRRATRRWPAPRCCSTCRPATSPSARPRRAACCAAASRRAPSRPMPIRRRARANRPPTSPGTATPRSTRCGDQLAETERFATDSTIVTRRRRSRPHPPGAPAQQQLRRHARAGGATGSRASARVDVRARSRRRAAWRWSAPIERFPYVPSDPAKLRDNCYEAYNIQVQGLAQRLQSSRRPEGGHRRLRRPQFDPGADRACRAMDQLGLPRTNILAYTLPGFGTSDKTHRQRLAADEGARRHGGRDRHQAGGAPDAGRHRPSLRQGRDGLRRHLRERAGGPAHRLPVPPRQPASRHGGRHRRPVRAGARLVHLRRRRSHVALQPQRLGLEDADPAPDPLRRGLGRRRRGDRRRSCTTSSTPRSRPS